MFIAICDDNSTEMAEIIKVLNRISYITKFDNFNEPAALLQNLTKCSYDVILLDIMMPSINGMELAKIIRKQNNQVYIVFITGYEYFCVDAFSIYATDYILKPLNADRLEKTLDRIYKMVSNPEENKTIELRTQLNTYRVNENEIIFIEKLYNRCMVYTDQFSFDVIMPIRHFEDILSKLLFIRSHSGFLVNTKKISRIEAIGNLSYIIHFKNTEKTARLSRNKRNKLLKVEGTVDS